MAYSGDISGNQKRGRKGALGAGGVRSRERSPDAGMLERGGRVGAAESGRMRGRARRRSGTMGMGRNAEESAGWRDVEKQVNDPMNNLRRAAEKKQETNHS